MKRNLPILILAALLFLTVSAYGADKFVIIPLWSQRIAPCTGQDEVMSAGQCWKNRNLGASQVATFVNDSQAYGDLYQWGRSGRGHQNRNSFDDALTSSYDDPGINYFKFLTQSSPPYDWRNPQNNNLWQGSGGLNNPCPQGFRLPTEVEWMTEIDSWSSKNAAGAYGSPLKLVVAGYRNYSNASIFGVNTTGDYWSSTTSYAKARRMSFNSSGTSLVSENRAHGASVRCIKEIKPNF